jgi:hypothetical protein
MRVFIFVHSKSLPPLNARVDRIDRHYAYQHAPFPYQDALNFEIFETSLIILAYLRIMICGTYLTS